ncbi:hypothetical protein C8A05DRAFT_47349 [Staphylotrichum tortipilum]|uniref:N-acetyltransferase domain-containing protein n=1 Tax=Staphylotrichum tortipilum TaxID=2831512 RepID=A0AAN6RP60_9PEZI|nr:hypothetical protein C8A05DRAFT_47349 [Staphylotrichum longicolle]
MPFRIRDALPGPSNADAQFITAAFDSCIPHLATIGSATQWGTTPLSSTRPGFLDRHIAAIADAEQYRLAGSRSLPVRVLIAEALVPPPASASGAAGTGEGSSKEIVVVPVGAATLRGGYLPGYVRDQEHLQEITGRLLSGEEGGYMFLEVLVTDFSEATSGYRKGAGAALVKFAREWAETELGMGAMFYEAQGFQRIDGFVVEKPDGEKWPGMFLQMDFGKKDSD